VKVTARCRLFFHIDDFATLVMTAVGANPVGQAHFTAVAALYQVVYSQGIVGATLVPAGAGMFPFW
jgi:hypothetical protein